MIKFKLIEADKMEDNDIVTLTEDFEKYMDIIIEAEKSKGIKDPYFLIDLKGGGCSGFQYDKQILDFDDLEKLFLERKEDYSVIKRGNVKVAIPQNYEIYFSGSEISYDKFEGVKVTNPNASSSCGCGISFSM